MKLLIAFLASIPLVAQVSSSTARHIGWGTSLPATCSPSTGDIFFKTSATVGPYYCSAANTWSAMSSGSPGDAVQGASSLTSVGAVPYVVSSGTLAQMSGMQWTNAAQDLVLLNSGDPDNGLMVVVSGSANGDSISSGNLFAINPWYFGPLSIGDSLGSSGGGINLQAAPGGDTTIETSGTGGSGGSVTISAGGGGTAPAAANNSTGGNGGLLWILGISGGGASVANSTNTGGSGSSLLVNLGDGGNASNGNTNNGGDGGGATFTLGSGGTGSTANGADGSYLIQAGARANASIFKVQSNGGATDYLAIAQGGNQINYRGVSLPVVTKTNSDSPYSATVANHVILCDSSSGSVTINLPALSAAVSSGSGLVLTVKKISASNTCTLDGDGGETIDGSTTLDITSNNESKTIIAASGGWRVI